MRGERGWVESAWAEVQRRRFAADPKAFFAECVWVPNPGADGGRARFVLYDYQEDDLERLLEDDLVQVLKARQLGLTTLLTAVCLWELMFQPGTNILYVSRTRTVADKALDLLDFMYRFLPEWLVPLLPTPDVDQTREHTWLWDDGMTSRIFSEPATDKVGASETTTRVVWDEAALAEGSVQDDAYRSMQPTTLAGGKLVVISTARGGSNWFARFWRQSVEGETGFTTIFHPWFVSRLINPLAEKVADCPAGPCPKCVDDTRYQAIKRSFPADKINKFYAEYASSPAEAFRKSGRPRFADLAPEEAFVEFDWRGRVDVTVGRLVEDEDGPLRMHADLMKPPNGAEVVIAVDPASGVGGDYSVATIGWLDADGTPVVAGIWRSNVIEPVDLARDVACLGALLGPREALVVVERQGGWGTAIIQELQNQAYSNLYSELPTGKRNRVRSVQYGFGMSWAKRPLVIDRLAKHVPTEDEAPGEILGLAPVHFRELAAFVRRDDGKVAADDGMHDDCVMSLAIFNFVALERGVLPKGREAPPERPQGVNRIDIDAMFRQADRAQRSANEQAVRRRRRRAHRSARKASLTARRH